MRFRQQLLLSLALVLLVRPAVINTFPDENTLLDRFVQFVWDPSALVYVWTALDQLFYVVLSWRMSALNAATLPFREPKSIGDSIRFNGRDLAVGRVKTRPIPNRLDYARMTKPVRQSTYPPQRLPYPLMDADAWHRFSQMDVAALADVRRGTPHLATYELPDQSEVNRLKELIFASPNDLSIAPEDLFTNKFLNVNPQMFPSPPRAKLKLLLQLLGELNPRKHKNAL